MKFQNECTKPCDIKSKFVHDKYEEDHNETSMEVGRIEANTEGFQVQTLQ